VPAVNTHRGIRAPHKPARPVTNMTAAARSTVTAIVAAGGGNVEAGLPKTVSDSASLSPNGHVIPVAHTRGGRR